jgi:hypothetical protein
MDMGASSEQIDVAGSHRLLEGGTAGAQAGTLALLGEA